MSFFSAFIWMVLGHFVADYPLQSDFVAKFKARSASLAAVPWYYVLSGHAATHAVAVGLVTGSLTLALAEFVCHWIIDLAKCEGLTTIHLDQGFHVACKFCWAMLALTLIR
jgi:uncharacterized protein DUF3307